MDLSSKHSGEHDSSFTETATVIDDNDKCSGKDEFVDKGNERKKNVGKAIASNRIAEKRRETTDTIDNGRFFIIHYIRRRFVCLLFFLSAICFSLFCHLNKLSISLRERNNFLIISNRMVTRETKTISENVKMKIIFDSSFALFLRSIV